MSGFGGYKQGQKVKVKAVFQQVKSEGVFTKGHIWGENEEKILDAEVLNISPVHLFIYIPEIDYRMYLDHKKNQGREFEPRFGYINVEILTDTPVNS